MSSALYAFMKLKFEVMRVLWQLIRSFQNKSDRITRKRHIEENQKLLAIKQILDEIKKRNVKLEDKPMKQHGSTSKSDDFEVDEELQQVERELASLPTLEPCHPSAQGSKVF